MGGREGRGKAPTRGRNGSSNPVVGSQAAKPRTQPFYHGLRYLRSMAHKVSFAVPERPVGNADIEFTIHTDGKMVGRLKVSKGGLAWMPAYAKKYEYALGWARFADLMEERGRKSSG